MDLEKKQQRNEKIAKKGNAKAKGKGWKKDSDKFREFMTKQKEAMQLQENNIIHEESHEDDSQMQEDNMKQLRPGAFEINMKDSIVRGSIAQIDFTKAKKTETQTPNPDPNPSNEKHIEIKIGSTPHLKATQPMDKKLDQSQYVMQESKTVICPKIDNENSAPEIDIGTPKG